MPMLMAGKTMWKDTVNANCNLARWSASKISMISLARVDKRLRHQARASYTSVMIACLIKQSGNAP
jgi:hypothetical protein